MSKKVTILTFTDPMMGLSYESEPVFRKLETHFGENIDFKYLMCVLVKDVYDLVNPADLSISKELAIKNYNAKLAKIYEDEEYISDMPINMTDFHLFSVEHTSSLPLNLAYKAAQLVDASKADLFLYNLRYATIVECRSTTQTEEILEVVRATGIDEEKFLEHFNGDTSKSKLNLDLQFAQRLSIRTLPSYLVEYDGEAILYQGLIDYEGFVSMIDTVSNGAVKPKNVTQSIIALRNLIKQHPLISPIEIREAFDLNNLIEVEKFIAPLVDSKEILIENVHHGYFIKKN